MTFNRKLAPVEQAMEILNRRAASNYIVTISRINGPLSKEIVRQALDLIQSRHPRLRSRIVGTLDNLCFEDGATQIPLRVVDIPQKESWLEVVLSELNQKIESDRGLIRCVLVFSQSENNISYLITTIHHAISDGLSSVQLHSEILTYCQKIASGEIISEVVSLPTLPPIQELLPNSIQGFQGVIKSILLLIKLRLKTVWYRAENLGLEKYVPIESRSCGMVHRRLEEKRTQQFTELCRKENTTVHSALCAAMMLVLSIKISNEKRKNVRLSCRTSINLRKRLLPEINNENLGVLASAITSFHTIATNSIKTHFWDLAREVKQSLSASLSSDDIFSMVLLYKKIVESLLSHPNRVAVSVAVTNVGRVSIPHNYGSFELEEISFVPSQAAFGGIVSAAVTTSQSQMLLNFMFSQPSIAQNTMEEFANDVITCLNNVCSPN